MAEHARCWWYGRRHRLGQNMMQHSWLDAEKVHRACEYAPYETYKTSMVMHAAQM